MSAVWHDIGNELTPYKNPQNYIDAGKEALKIGGTALAFYLPVTRAGPVLYGGYQMCRVAASRQFLNQSIRTSVAVESATLAMADTAAFTYAYSSQAAYYVWLEGQALATTAYLTSPMWGPPVMEFGLGYYDPNPPPLSGPGFLGFISSKRETFFDFLPSECNKCGQK